MDFNDLLMSTSTAAQPKRKDEGHVPKAVDKEALIRKFQQGVKEEDAMTAAARSEQLAAEQKARREALALRHKSLHDFGMLQGKRVMDHVHAEIGGAHNAKFAGTAEEEAEIPGAAVIAAERAGPTPAALSYDVAFRVTSSSVGNKRKRTGTDVDGADNDGDDEDNTTTTLSVEVQQRAANPREVQRRKDLYTLNVARDLVGGFCKDSVMRRVRAQQQEQVLDALRGAQSIVAAAAANARKKKQLHQQHVPGVTASQEASASGGVDVAGAPAEPEEGQQQRAASAASSSVDSLDDLLS